MRTVSYVLREHAARNPGRRFCTVYSGSQRDDLTYGSLYAGSLQYAARFVELDCKPGDLVLIMHPHSPHLFYAFLGAMLAGCVPSFMPFPSPKQRADLFWRDHEALFARITPHLLVTSNAIEAQARAALSTPLPMLVADDAILEGPQVDDLPGFHASPFDVACLQHSSGTTGLKKGVRLTHDAILKQIDSYAKRLAIGDSDAIASWLPLYHDMGFIACFMLPLVTMVPVAALDAFEWTMRPRKLLDVIDRERATLTWLPNFAFMHLANAVPEDRWDLSSMRAFINCSEPCKPAAFRRFLERFASNGVRAEQLHVCYAMAENVFAVTQTTLGTAVSTWTRDDGMELLSCGAPIDGVELRIDSQRTAADEVGEILIAGACLFDGYDRLPEKTAERLRDGWYHSGDLGTIVDGELYVCGRIDDMLIVAGRNFYAHEIEEIASETPLVVPGRVVAVGVDDENTGTTHVVVLAETGEASPDTPRAIAQRIFDRLSLAVHEVVMLRKGELVKTTSGKISRSENLRLYRNGRFSSVEVPS